MSRYIHFRPYKTRPILCLPYHKHALAPKQLEPCGLGSKQTLFYHILLRVNNLSYLKCDSPACSSEFVRIHRKEKNLLFAFDKLFSSLDCFEGNCRLFSALWSHRERNGSCKQLSISRFSLFLSCFPTNRKGHEPGPSFAFFSVLVISI